MVFRRVQVLIVGLIAISALERAAHIDTQADATARTDRLANATRSEPHIMP